MWLAVNDYGDYIWTESSNDTIVWRDDLIEIQKQLIVLTKK